MPRRVLILGCVLLWGYNTVALAQVPPAWQGYFQQQVAQMSSTTADQLSAVTLENWTATQAAWREELQEMLGLSPWPERTDLESTVVGSIAVEGVNIDRLHYQSRPGLYVGANLYQPSAEAPADGWPAVLYVCGHARVTEQGRLLGNKASYQHHGLWLARHGVVCLIIDTVQLGEFHGEHHGTYKLGRWDWISRGYTPAGVEAWNAIRGIDLLQSLPYVNGQKIGITGRSGGGAYSWFAAALDDRIQVAVPVAGITDLQNHVIDGCVEGHCDCMYFVNYHRWDYGKLAALIAPRALLLSNSDSDGIFPLDGVIRIHNQLAPLYARLKASDRYGVIITPGPHKDTQELQVGAFKWLLKHLTGTEPVIGSAALKELAMPELAVFEAETPLEERVTSVGTWFVPTAQPTTSAAQATKLWSQQWLPEMHRLGLLPGKIPSLTLVASATGLTGQQTWTLLEADPAAGPQLLRIAGSDETQAPVVHLGVVDSFLWSEATVEQALADPAVQALVNHLPTRTHYFVKWHGSHWWTESLSSKQKHQLVRRFYLLGQSPEQNALIDFLASLQWIGTQSEASRGMELAGQGRYAPLVTLAGLSFNSLAGKRLITGLHLGEYPTDPILAPTLPGVLRVCDFASLRLAAEKSMSVHALGETGQASARLVDTASEPQQANGIRIVEVSDKSARVWMRATRWPLANLGDLPEVQFARPAEARSKQNRDPILPALGVEGLRYAVPGVPAEVRVGHRARRGGVWKYSDWVAVDASSDFSGILEIAELQPATSYEVRTEVRGLGRVGSSSTMTGTFRTLPAADTAPQFRLAVGTCQAFIDRDGPHGFDLYRTMLRRGTDAFVMAGDVVYYDSLARSKELAYYHWQRTYSLPTLVEFHRQVPTFFLKDDHDTYVNDTWPGSRLDWTGDFTFEDGQEIFIQQTGLPSPAYRTFSVGADLQVWLLEGRDFRSPNNAPDGPDKSIWGLEQKAWLKNTLAESTARFRVVISPTPIVGPDRENKTDNHSNRVFETEGREARQFLASHPNTVVVCGDRHWQFHSVDPESGLHEFSVGPASERHAGGWNAKDYRPEIHKFLRVGGGYLEMELTGAGDSRELTLRHLDTHGREQHSHTLR